MGFVTNSIVRQKWDDEHCSPSVATAIRRSEVCLITFLAACVVCVVRQFQLGCRAPHGAAVALLLALPGDLTVLLIAVGVTLFEPEHVPVIGAPQPFHTSERQIR